MKNNANLIWMFSAVFFLHLLYSLESTLPCTIRASEEGFHQLLVKFFLVVEEVPAEVSIASRGNATAEESMEDECTHRSPVTMSVSMFSSLSITLLSEFCHNKTPLTWHINEKWHFILRHRPPQSAAGMNQPLSEVIPKLTELFQILADARLTFFSSIVNVRRGALNSSLCAIVLLCLRGNCVLMRWTHERDFKSKLSWAGVCCLACASVF